MNESKINFYLSITQSYGPMGSDDNYRILSKEALSKLKIHDFLEVYELGKKLESKDL